MTRPATDYVYRTADNHPLVQALFQRPLTQGVNFSIHRHDEMFSVFFHNIARDFDRALAMYFHSGLTIATTFLDLIAAYSGAAANGTVLDFAAGYGRVTRFLLAALRPSQLWVSEIDPQAVDFHREEFCVGGLVSTELPENFECRQKFRVILVSSLFTHLPERPFVGWLERLSALLEDDGLLVFSVHDMVLAPSGHEQDFVFSELSESAHLPGASYGSTWVSERYVTAALARLGMKAVRFRRGLASYQDLYVAQRVSAKSAWLQRLPIQASGHVEHCSWLPGNKLQLSGWLTDRDGHGDPVEIVASVDGTDVDRCQLFDLRPEVALVFGEAGVRGFGWRLSPALTSSGMESQELHLGVTWPDGSRGTLYRGTVAECLLRGVRLDLLAVRQELLTAGREHENQLAGLRASHAVAVAALEEAARRQQVTAAELAAKIQWMQASRFWKARNRWFQIKQLLGLR